MLLLQLLFYSTERGAHARVVAFGGIQLEVYPMRAEVFQKRFPVRPQERLRARLSLAEADVLCREASAAGMGLAPGGRMRQEIYDDPFSNHDWDTERRGRCFIHLVNSLTWKAITGENPPSKPATAKDYTKAGYPWFDYYDAEQKALNGSPALAVLKSVLQMGREKRESPLPENQSTNVTNLVNLRAGLKPHQVRESDFV